MTARGGPRRAPSCPAAKQRIPADACVVDDGDLRCQTVDTALEPLERDADVRAEKCAEAVSRLSAIGWVVSRLWFDRRRSAQLRGPTS
jgi:hypothetical protein